MSTGYRRRGRSILVEELISSTPLATFLSYPEEIRSSIYTTKILERINKEMKRRINTIEFFSQVKIVEKIIYLVSMELNER